MREQGFISFFSSAAQSSERKKEKKKVNRERSKHGGEKAVTRATTMSKADFPDGKQNSCRVYLSDCHIAMEIQKVYVKSRAEFGKHCFFEKTMPILDVDILPDPPLIKQYIRKSHCHVGVQHSKKFALHEADLSTTQTKNSGMSHFEGGWPKEINPRDEEATARFRKRVEKDDNWGPKLSNLFKIMHHNVLQNGTVNIYQHYFDDMIPTELVQPIGLRTVNSYRDPETPRRPVSCISWSTAISNRIAVTYCFLEFGRLSDYSHTVYIWEVDNSNEPFMGLDPFSPCVTTEFNPRDPYILVSGLLNGQVCSWDTRASKKPVQASHVQYSHRGCVNGVKWLSSKRNTEFFSTSVDGRAMWWDTRQLRAPTETIVFDLEQPNEPNLDKAIGISSLNHGPTVGMKFMCGLDNGIILTGSRKAKTNAEKLAVRLEAHNGRVISVDRNVLNPMIFLSVGDWRAHVWAEDTREGCLFTIPFMKDYPTGGCWNKARFSAFYVITTTGQLLVWDILQTLRHPVFKLQLCQQPLTCLASSEEGDFLTVGNIAGEVFLVEPTEFFQSFEKAERALFSEYMEKCSRVTKAVDVRLKEIRLVQKIVQDEVAVAKQTKEKKKKGKGGSKGKPMKPKKESRWSKGKEKKKFKDEPLEIMEAENKYFEAIHKDLEVYATETDPDVIPVSPIKKYDKTSRKSKNGTSPDRKTRLEENTSRVRKKSQMTKKGVPKVLDEKKQIPDEMRSSVPSMSGQSAEQSSPDDDTDKEQPGKKETAQIKFKLPVPCEGEVCKPKVCCWRTGSRGRRIKTSKESSVDLSDLPEETRRSTMADERQQLLLGQMYEPPSVLKEEVTRAIVEVRIAHMKIERSQQSAKSCIEVKKRAIRKRTRVQVSRRTPARKDQDWKILLRRKKRKQVTPPDPCSPTKTKTVYKQLSQMIDISPVKLSEMKIEGSHYMHTYEAFRKRVYPRISEFHMFE